MTVWLEWGDILSLRRASRRELNLKTLVSAIDKSNPLLVLESPFRAFNLFVL